MCTVIIALTGETRQRSLKVAALVEKLNPVLLVITGKAGKLNKKKRWYSEARVFQRALKSLNINTPVNLEEKARDTREHFIYLPKMLDAKLVADKDTRFICVTNWWHVPRAKLACWLYWPEARGRVTFAAAGTGCAWWRILLISSWWEPTSAALIMWKYLRRVPPIET